MLSQRRTPYVSSPKSLAAFLLTLTGAIIAGAGCRIRSLPSTFTAPAIAADAEFLGDAACAGCHPAATRDHRLTRHAATLHSANRSQLDRLAPPTGLLPATDIKITESGGRFGFSVPGDHLDFSLALGSGKTGVTYVAFVDSQTLFEPHKSYFPSRKKWYVTPGHEKKPASDVGVVYDRTQAAQCLRCHATTLPADRLEPESKFFGVGCEACHGPGSAHVAATLAGSKDLRLERSTQLGGKRINEMCGKCHRTAESTNLSSPQAKMTQRFQSYGLSLSRCFKESKDKLSCVTCHNPHQNASTDPKVYEAACLKCHAKSNGPIASTSTSTSAIGYQRPNDPITQSPNRPCPINPRTGCIPCHMPTRQVFVSTDVPTNMADHRIAIQTSTLQQ